MKIKTELTIASLLAVGLLAVAFATSASAFNSTQQRFKAEIKGVQTYTSDFDRASTDTCDPLRQQPHQGDDPLREQGSRWSSRSRGSRAPGTRS